MSRFFCLVFQHFPWYAAQQNEPSLRHHAVVIVQGNKVIAASPPARAAGATIGWTLSRAVALLPNVRTVFHNPAVTAVAWDGVLAALFSHSPCVESIRPGLAFMAVAASNAKLPSLKAWDAQAGIADDRATAELAARTARPAVCRAVRSGRHTSFLRQVPVDILQEVGVSPETIERLGWFGWTNIADLHRLTSRQLRAQFAEADILYRYAQGNDVRAIPAYRLPDEIEASFLFETPVSEPQHWQPALILVCEEVVRQLQGKTVRAVELQIQTPHKVLKNRRLLREATAAPRAIIEHAQTVMVGLARHKNDIEKLTVVLGGLQLVPPIQSQLFRPSRPPIMPVLRHLERRFPGLMRRAVSIDAEAYLPEDGCRLEPVSFEANAASVRPMVDGQARHCRPPGRSSQLALP